MSDLGFDIATLENFNPASVACVKCCALLQSEGLGLVVQKSPESIDVARFSD
ncbi:hypothetical protein [Halomicronema sp. CCY15110]|uniref:hypothetical protein n=1 Tax=Halomicronema sp. CCY15110 TaxID=2767773 RepID=UPI0019514175|nr:hypothetical protein [Halomicronema sp. CCY15110]